MTATLDLSAPSIGTRAPYATSAERVTLEQLLRRAGARCDVVLPDGRVQHFGTPPARFRITVRAEDLLPRRLDELALGRAYIAGDFDLDGDMVAAMDVRSALPDRIPLITRLGFWLTMLRHPLQRNRAAIDSHYAVGDDFYLAYIDRRYRFYSHGIFHADDESLEDASEHKLERMVEALGLQPGMRLLDIGGGWGGVADYCGRRGVHVTELTIAHDSHAYIRKLIDEENLTADVLLEDFLAHRPAQPYDAIVIYGVIEHIPNYRRFCERVWECLRPGGRLYVDASASREKFRLSAFSRRFIWPGTHSPLCLQDFVQEVLLHGMTLLEVGNETRDYGLTMWHWAQRFDEQRDRIIARWGERTYRAFRLYLWGGCWGFFADRMQAYHLVIERGPARGPRPGFPARVRSFAKGLLSG